MGSPMHCDEGNCPSASYSHLAVSSTHYSCWKLHEAFMKPLMKHVSGSTVYCQPHGLQQSQCMACPSWQAPGCQLGIMHWAGPSQPSSHSKSQLTWCSPSQISPSPIPCRLQVPEQLCQGLTSRSSAVGFAWTVLLSEGGCLGQVHAGCVASATQVASSSRLPST